MLATGLHGKQANFSCRLLLQHFLIVGPVMTTSHFPARNDRALKHAAIAVAVLILCIAGGPAQAVDAVSAGHAPGFWAGFADGLLSLLKFMASPLTEFTIFDGDAQSRLYDVGYLLGVLAFTGAAGVAASSTEAEMGKSRWE